ncbi:MAG: hypothetical protein NC541_11535 [bacterium]|nr:hypothetical protein [bacterium]
MEESVSKVEREAGRKEPGRKGQRPGKAELKKKRDRDGQNRESGVKEKAESERKNL